MLQTDDPFPSMGSQWKGGLSEVAGPRIHQRNKLKTGFNRSKQRERVRKGILRFLCSLLFNLKNN